MFEAILCGWLKEAAELLGVGERTFRRWSRRNEEDGEAGLLDRRLGKASGRPVPVDRAEEVEALYRMPYAGFTAKHFHEHLVCGIIVSTRATAGPRPSCSRRNFWRRSGAAVRIGASVRAGRCPACCCIRTGREINGLRGTDARSDVTLDDATSAIYSAFLVEEEGTAPSTLRNHASPLISTDFCNKICQKRTRALKEKTR